MNRKIGFIIPLLMLTSCGAQLNNIAPVTIDHSANWKDNYYTYFDAFLKEKAVIDVNLDKTTNKVFTAFNDPNFILLEEEASDLNNYYNDFASDGFGPSHKLSSYNENIKEGFVSKLYDGQFFCHQYYELSRVQIREAGFSSSFYKTLESASYLYLNFKSAIDFKTYRVGSHYSSFIIHITFYGEENYRYSYELNDVPTNAGENYVFYGFSLEGLNLKGVKDYSITYTLIDEPAHIEDPNAEHALLLYEFGLKNPIFK